MAGCGWRCFKYATQARCLMRPNGHCYAVRSDRSAINPIDLVLDAGVVEQISRGKIVCAVQHHVAIFDESLNVRMVDVGYLRFNFDLMVQLMNVIGGRNCLRDSFSRIAFSEHCLTLKI